jgi:hypothetical protein
MCDIAPPGWHCTREDEHEGPCAAWPIARSIDEYKALRAEFKRFKFLCSLEIEKLVARAEKAERELQNLVDSQQDSVSQSD